MRTNTWGIHARCSKKLHKIRYRETAKLWMREGRN